MALAWTVPAADAVTLGELNGELYSVSPRDEAHIGDEFVRRGGSVFPPARVVCAKTRRPFGQEESLTQELEDADALDSGAVRMLKRAARAAASFLMDDELDVLQTVFESAQSGVRRLVGTDVDLDKDELGAATLQSREAEPIAALDWHRALNVLAVGQQDNVVSLYDVAAAKWDARVLDHRAQAGITAVQWAPHSGGVIAVASRGGVLLWKVPVKKEKEEPTLLDILKHPRKTAFHQLSWNADGSLLAAFARNSTSVYIFDVIRSRSTELQCPCQAEELKWSPSGDYLFATTARGVSVIWETLTWRRETWDVPAANCAWSVNGRCLMVALRNSSLLYPYIFQEPPPSLDARINSPAIDFSEKLLTSLDKTTSAYVGGHIEKMAWDPNGKRVAAIYRTTTPSPQGDSTGQLVAIFTVTWKPFLIFSRSGLLRGPPNAGFPRHVAFASTFEGGALLSVAWSSGLITFYPFYY